MADAGFDFRATGAFVTDPANCSPVLGEAYPTTYSNGVTAGWSGAGFQTRDRSAAVDARVAGVNFHSSGGLRWFRIDLAGPLDIAIAQGDQGANATAQDGRILDGLGWVLNTYLVNQSTGATNRYYDATGVLRTSDTDWASNNVPFSAYFGEFVRVEVGFGAGGSGTLAHVRATTNNNITPSLRLPDMRTFPRHTLRSSRIIGEGGEGGTE